MKTIGRLKKSTKERLGRIVFYGRSATNGMKGGKTAFDIQTEAANEWMKQRGLPELADKDIFFDSLASGSNGNREALDKLRAEIRAGGVSAVLAVSFDRLSRNARQGVRFIRELEDYGVRLCLVKENVDTSTAMGKVLLKIVETIDECYRQEKKDRMLRQYRCRKDRVADAKS